MSLIAVFLLLQLGFHVVWWQATLWSLGFFLFNFIPYVGMLGWIVRAALLICVFTMPWWAALFIWGTDIRTIGVLRRQRSVQSVVKE
jgi:predicted PurR-regulated permease PerM